MDRFAPATPLHADSMWPLEDLIDGADTYLPTCPMSPNHGKACDKEDAHSVPYTCYWLTRFDVNGVSSTISATLSFS